MNEEAAIRLKQLLAELALTGFVAYPQVDSLFRDPQAQGEVDAFLLELERGGGEVRADAGLCPVEAEKIELGGGEPLAVYVREVAAVPLLSREREIELFRLIESESGGAFLAKKELVEANLGVVISIARGYCLAELDILDLIERGNLGLFQAVESFRAGPGYRFATYAALWVHRMLNELVVG